MFVYDDFRKGHWKFVMDQRIFCSELLTDLPHLLAVMQKLTSGRVSYGSWITKNQKRDIDFSGSKFY